MQKLSKDERHFLLRRLHSLTGIVPLGGFLLFHFFENAAARNGPEAFNTTVSKIGEMPYLYVMEVCFLAAPILFHSIYGLLITSEARPNVTHYSYARNWAYFMQRLTGILAFVYIGYHVITTRGWALTVKGSDITFLDMAQKLAPSYAIAAYVIGILAVTYHFANGIWGFSITWGLARTEASQKRLAAAVNILFVALAVMGLDIMSAFVVPGGMFIALKNLVFG